MSIDYDVPVEVERGGKMLTIAFGELRVGDAFSLLGECWFVSTQLKSFGELKLDEVFRYHSNWYMKVSSRYAQRLEPDIPFGKPIRGLLRGVPFDLLVGSLLLEKL